MPRRLWLPTAWAAAPVEHLQLEREVIPDSFVLITIVLAIPVLGLLTALVVSRIPSRRSDS